MTESAATIITRNVISVGLGAGALELAGLLAKHCISPAPAIEANGELLGMIARAI
jgi:CBS domain-containing protein